MPALQHYFDAERLRRGWTMRETAKRSQISLSKAYAISNGDDNVEFETFENIAAAFDMSPAELAVAIGKGSPGEDPKRAPIHARIRQVPDEDLGLLDRLVRTLVPSTRAKAVSNGRAKTREQSRSGSSNGPHLRYRERTFGLSRQPALWLTPKGNRFNPNGLRTMLSMLCEEAGIDGNRPPHAFRRGYFTAQYMDAPTALPVLVERMGWESDAMSKVYTRGVDVELARRIPLPLQTRKWRNTPYPNGPSPRARAAPMLAMDVGSNVGNTQRPSPALPWKSGQEPGRVVNPRMGQRS